jgi:hypothetical protein
LQQTIGLRVNVIMDQDPQIVTKHPKFDYEGDIKVWQVPVEVEYESALTIDMLNEDFQLVPFITGLTENVEFDKSVFVTKGKKRNIIFVEKDK